ncbi:MAG: glycoside hydrolase domain-containing protein [Candidatus Fervidibacter sp.]|uniref:glycoside hydrolase domain-containing protein n=1 Tax=Candidatus Fervidibacter sp. TaxID=3100871 RepID=UPI00404AD1CA
MRESAAMVSVCVFSVMLALCFEGRKTLPSKQTSTNFTMNGDFEDGKGLLPSNWSLGFYPQRAGIEKCVHRSRDRVRSGQWSLRIDTQPVLGEEVTLVFNGAVSREIVKFKGQQLTLSGWVYIEPGTAVRPVTMRLRTFGKDESGNIAFLGDVLEGKVLGEPGKWVHFQFSGTMPDRDITSMDLHCHIQPDLVRTVQFLDELRLEVFTPPKLEVLLPHSAIWRDEPVLPIEVRWHGDEKVSSFEFQLIDGRDRIVKRWRGEDVTSVLGLEFSLIHLPEGRYSLRCNAFGSSGKPLAAFTSTLEIAASPWEGTTQRKSTRRLPLLGTKTPEGFDTKGTVAPTDLPDFVTSKPEPVSPDLKLGQWQQKGHVVFSRHWLDSFSRTGRPLPGEIAPVRVFASQGEYEPALVLVWALKPLKEVQISMSDLEGEKAVISSNSVEVRVVRFIRNLPTFTERRKQVDITEGQTQSFLLTIFVPPETPAGFYRGSINIRPANAPSTDVDLLLRVLPLRLPTSPKGYGFWWKMDARWNGYYSKEREAALEQIRKQFILLREYGCNMVSCYGMPKVTRTSDGTLSFDFTQDHWGHDSFSLSDFFRLGRETKFFSPKVPLQYPGAESLHSHWIAKFVGVDRYSKELAPLYREACHWIDKWAKGQGFTLAFACVDEIGNSPDRRRDALHFYRIAKDAGVLTSVTDNSMHGGVYLTGQNRFDDIVDMRLYNFVTPEMIEHTKRSGDRLWLYNLGSAGWYAKLDRFVFGFFAECCGAEGVSQWAFQWPSGGASPYEAAAVGKPTGWHYALPAPDGPLPTLALEGVREGIDDARYLHLLQPRQREPFLKDIKPLSTEIHSFLKSRSGKALDILRWKVAREAMEAKL